MSTLTAPLSSSAAAAAKAFPEAQPKPIEVARDSSRTAIRAAELYNDILRREAIAVPGIESLADRLDGIGFVSPAEVHAFKAKAASYKRFPMEAEVLAEVLSDLIRTKGMKDLEPIRDQVYNGVEELDQTNRAMLDDIVAFAKGLKRDRPAASRVLLRAFDPITEKIANAVANAWYNLLFGFFVINISIFALSSLKQHIPSYLREASNVAQRLTANVYFASADTAVLSWILVSWGINHYRAFRENKEKKAIRVEINRALER